MRTTQAGQGVFIDSPGILHYSIGYLLKPFLWAGSRWPHSSMMDREIEVYVDDMIAKSLDAESHIVNLRIERLRKSTQPS